MTTDKHWDLLEEIDWLFRKTVRKFVKERDKVTVEGITLPGLLILNKIIRDGEQKLSDLAEQLDFTSGAVTALCDKLEKKGFATRRRNPEDRRIVHLDITSVGRDMMDRNSNIGVKCITLLLGGFSLEELQQQKQYYQRTLENLEHFSQEIMSLAEANTLRHQTGEKTLDTPIEPSNFIRY